MFCDILFGHLTTVNRCETTACCLAIMNYANPDLITSMEFTVSQCDPSIGETQPLDVSEDFLYVIVPIVGGVRYFKLGLHAFDPQ